ncbi:MAG TPA: polyphosphate kinase 1 [Polyangiaceae bacterium]|nr:polyphosphate kinase 1 [Polyangiaceae bacterium]
MNASRYVNRELSWLEFNQRVLEEAQDPTVPLLERVKFLAIVSSNLDEFFMVRVAGIKRDIARGVSDGETPPTEVLQAVSRRVREQSAEQHRCFLQEIKPALEAEGIRLVRPDRLSTEQREFLEQHLKTTLLPVLTPVAIDPGHPFPHLVNRSLCLVAAIRPTTPSVLPNARMVVVHMPSQAARRFIRLPSPQGEQHFMLLEDLVRHHLPLLYHGYEVLSCHAIRVTRDAEFDAEQTARDRLAAIEAALRERRMGPAVRLQYDADLPQDVLETLVQELGLEEEDLYAGEGLTAFADLFELYAALDIPRLKDPPMTPMPVPAFDASRSMFASIREGDVLVHHPYQSFDVVTRFVHEAAIDPKVLAIKMTLYRVSPTSPIAQALRLAAENGKEVAVLVELMARFDEEANIRWARALEDVGAHVVYGLPAHKTHCKACLIVRQEADGIRRYCHVATGNYHAKTAGLYTDLGLFTCRESFGEDLTEVFNLLTGYMRPRPMTHLLIAPTSLREGLLERVRREAAHARAGRPARIVLKMNSLVDRPLIDALYEASDAGVDIALIIRGICCLRPGVPGLSERIRAVSIVDRFLEHARVFYFENGGDPEYFLASADWMPRNLDHRVEIAFPVLAPPLREFVREVLDIQLSDNVKAREILPNGRSRRPERVIGDPIRAQERLYAMVAALEETAGGGTPSAPSVVAGAAHDASVSAVLS